MPDFHFYNQHNYWPLYTTIQQYYPLGLHHTPDRSGFAESYPGQIALEQIISERLSDYPAFRRRWKPFQEHLREQTKKPVHQEEGVYPSYQGYIPIRKRAANIGTHRKTLHFAISLLGPYFTIYALDTSSVELSETWHLMGNPAPKTTLLPHEAIHAVTVSPYEEYTELFHTLEAAILGWFPEYRLVPFSIGCMSLAGLIVEGCKTQPAPIHAALFHPNIPTQALSTPQCRGDQWYGSSRWRIAVSAS
ncbi:hypothetical protein [Hymenobacter lutimineralis]|uniref:hypothetical protein n=1 Tax=Hymenobacter lutimineralis TaxID=2606448 RepID=UPI0011EAD9E4|nr:hypothetical protein [Hymenobacter lutimineralis]